jgi:hypothetical protein
MEKMKDTKNLNTNISVSYETFLRANKLKRVKIAKNVNE